VSADETQALIEALRQVASDEGVYPLEAYCFLYQSLDRAQQEAGERRHVSGRELMEGARELAIEMFGPLTLMVFRHWRLSGTSDFGQMVFHLVERDLMGKSEDDSLEDFEGVYEFEEAFAPDALMARLDTKTLEPGPRLDPNRELGRSRPSTVQKG
jgi:uncharacterized repeat protein (TIGR04138 family)